MNTFSMRVTGAIVAAAALTGCGAAPPPSATAPAASSDVTIGPDRYGTLTLGMTFAEAKEAGFVRDGEPPGEVCQRYDLYAAGQRDGSVLISRERGVEAIVPDRRVRTAEGVEIGWAAEKVRTVYSELDLDLVAEMSRAAVSPPDSPAAVYRLGFSDSVLNSIALQVPDQGCYE